MATMHKINVRSHVGRDLLQSAEHFRTDRAVVWEYVANGLQYHSPGIPPVVRVSIDEKRKVIRVSDNGCGMDRNDLAHFFTMHGENRDRIAGQIGRGLFGTGKSAAFAIANSLRVTSVKHGRRSVALLARAQIEAARDGKEVPVDLLEIETPTQEPSGTEIEIADVHLRKIDRAATIRHIEHHLAHYPQDVQVYVDHHQCTFKAPEIAETQRFQSSDEERALLGDVVLVVNVARGPLEDDLRGIQIFSHGNWHETTLAGCEGKEMSEYLFGEIDVPAIEQYVGPNKPFDNTRSGKLSPANVVVESLFRFIGPAIDRVRRGLVAREKERSRTEEAKRLQRQASRLADVLSIDFADYQMKVARAQAASRGRDLGPAQSPGAAGGDGPWNEGGPEPAAPVDRHRTSLRGEKPGGLSDPPEFGRPVTPDSTGVTTGRPSRDPGGQRNPRGGFSVRYEHSGESEARGKYVADRRTIIINLDHPQVSAAFAIGGAETDAFLRLAIEVAISEYAIALAQELVEQYGLVDEALFDIRGSIDRVSRRMVPLYRSSS
jgi:hypothetical protein